MTPLIKQFTILLGAIALSITAGAQSAETWPKSLETADGALLKIYQPEPETLKGQALTFRAAISVTEKGMIDPVFGTFWGTGTIATDRDDRQILFTALAINDIRIPRDSAPDRLNYIRATIQSGFPAAAGEVPLDVVLTSLNQQMDEARLSRSLNTQPPVILFANRPSVLVTIDGTPRFEENKHWGLDAVINTPFTIVKDKDGKIYCWGGGHWYSSASATGPFSPLTTEPDRRLRKIEKEYKKNEPDSIKTAVDNITPDLIVTTTPAELIQTNGSPDLAPIEGTNLLYVANSPDNIFLDTQSQLYYILLSGRWYSSKTLETGNGFTYVASDQLPKDFAAIPETSPKGAVLTSVAGTMAAREAVMDAQIPQTAKVDRNNATVSIEYDGAPQFQSIAGTHLQYAVNTGNTVLFDTHRYFALDNGVWFVADNATGPWAVSTVRPDELNEIPPGCPVYNAKYVDIYDITPDYIYMGYTPGYLDNYVFGPTVVYGTGFYYSPWIGHYYYPRPWSWGFGFGYNPWFGWGFGLDYDLGWFNFGLGWDGWFGGWWGPVAYTPFCHGWGYMYAHNNLYRGRPGVFEHNEFRGSGAGIRPGVGFRRGEGPAFTDHHGNVFQRDEHGQWMNRTGHEDVRPMADGLDRQRQLQERGAFRTNSFQNARSFAAPHFGGFRPAGGGGFRGGFHGGRR